MAKDKKFLTDKELEFMLVVWEDDNSPKTSVQIAELAKKRSWSKNSLYAMINSLLDKGFIEVVGKVRCTKVNGRLYAAKISQAKYAVMDLERIFGSSGKRKKKIFKLITCLLQNNDSEIEDTVTVSQLIKMTKD